MDASFTDTSSVSLIPIRSALSLFFAGCLLSLCQVSYLTAFCAGATVILVQIVLSAALLLLPAAPYWYLVRPSGKGVGILAVTWMLVGILNLLALATCWPAKWMVAAHAETFINIHRSIQKEGFYNLRRKVGPLKVRQVQHFHENTFFITGGDSGSPTGLVYSPRSRPGGFNEWSCIPITKHWYMVEQD